MAWLFAASVLTVAAPRSACVSCGRTASVPDVPTNPRDIAGESARHREQREWEVGHERAYGGAGERPVVATPSPAAIGGAAAIGAAVGTGFGVAVLAAKDAGQPRSSTPNEAATPREGPALR